MLYIQEIVDWLNEKLNLYGGQNEDVFSFALYADKAEDIYDRNSSSDTIKGIVRTISSDFIPINENQYIEGTITFAAEFSVGAGTNYIALQIEKIVDRLVAENNGSQVDFKNGKGTLKISKGVPKEYKLAYGVGESVPISFTVQVAYTENAVTSVDKIWSIDGEIIPFASESVTVEYEGVTRKIFHEEYEKFLVTGQKKVYRFRVPYMSDWAKKWQSLILENTDYNRTYELAYYDGANYPSSARFRSLVKVYGTAISDAKRPDPAYFEVAFTDAFDTSQSPKYQIGLIDFPFDEQGEDTRYFESETEQHEYFDEAVADSGAFGYSVIDAPNLNSLYITRQVYKLPESSSMTVYDLASKNYAVIRIEKQSGYEYFYYFVTNVEIGSDRQIFLDLKLDTVQTYFFKQNISFADCMIERAHLNRFKPTDNPDYVDFVTDESSKIYNAEEGLNFPKRLVERTQLSIEYTGNDTIDSWLNTYVDYWVYVYISTNPEKNYKAENIATGTGNAEIPAMYGPYISMTNGFESPSGCFCYPIYKNQDTSDISKLQHKIIVRVKLTEGPYKDYAITDDGRSKFETLNTDTVNYFNIKVSKVAPFGTDLRGSINSVYVENGDLIFLATQSQNQPVAQLDYDAAKRFIAVGSLITGGLFWGASQTQDCLETEFYTISTDRTSQGFKKSDIIAANLPQVKFNPKMLGSNFQNITITTADGESFIYDIQKLQQIKIKFLYSEPLQPEITKYYMRVATPCGLYGEGTESNYTGLVGSTDNGLSFTSNAYAEFIANNKNFWMQSNFKIGADVAKSAIGIGMTAATGNVPGAVAGAALTGINVITSLVDRSKTVDNMKSVPDQMKNANGNCIFNAMVTKFGLYVEHHKALDGDLKTANDFMNLYGFSYNSIGNLKDFVNIRKYHNYIKAQIQGIYGAMSNMARNDLRQRFANGIRFWNSDDINYNHENYEKWLES